MKKTKIVHFDEYVYTTTLDNGLNVIIYPIENTKQFFVEHLVDIGSEVTDYELNNKKYKLKDGIAHFFEHCAFHRKEGHDEFFNEFDNLQLSSNAYTSSKITSYWFEGTKNLFEGLDLLNELVYETHFSNDSIEKEKKIVESEIQRSNSNINSMLFRNYVNSALNSKRYKVEILGTKESIRTITKEDMDMLHSHFYTPSNSTLFVVGGVNPKEVKNYLEKHYTNENKEHKITKIFEKETKEFKAKFVEFKHSNIPFDSYRVVNKTKHKFNTRNRLILHIINYSLFGRHGDFYENMIDNQLVDDISTSTKYYDDILTLYAYVETNNIEEFVKQFKKEIQEKEITKRDLELFIKSDYSVSIYRSENPNGALNTLVNDIVNYKEIIFDRISLLNSITVEEVNEMRKSIDLDNFIVIKNTKGE